MAARKVLMKVWLLLGQPDKFQSNKGCCYGSQIGLNQIEVVYMVGKQVFTK